MKIHPAFVVTAASLFLVACKPRVKLDNAITPAEAEQLAAAGLPEVRDVCFGDKFTLVGASSHVTGDGLLFELAWKANGKQKLAYLVPVHALDANGKIVGQADYHQDAQRREIAGGTIWRDEIAIPRESLVGATNVGVGLLGDGQKWLLPDHGSRDQESLLLLFPVPPELSKSLEQAPFDGFLEAVNNTEIVGWGWKKSEPAKALDIEVYDGDTRLLSGKADVAREDLAKAGIGDGRHGFRLPMPTELKDGKPHRIAVRVRESGFELHKSPQTFLFKK